MKPTIKDLLDSNNGTLPSYAWPGGYPIIYLDKDNNTLCPECANKVIDEIVEWDIYYEGPDMPCEECGVMIKSAYGDPDKE
jgi:hypothetical protein